MNKEYFLSYKLLDEGDVTLCTKSTNYKNSKLHYVILDKDVNGSRFFLESHVGLKKALNCYYCCPLVDKIDEDDNKLHCVLNMLFHGCCLENKVFVIPDKEELCQILHQSPIGRNILKEHPEYDYVDNKLSDFENKVLDKLDIIIDLLKNKL